jgi:hypothetical protein
MNIEPCREDGPDSKALAKMKSSSYNFPGTRWAAYENHDLGHWALGHLKFLAVGPQNTFKTAPTRLPDAVVSNRSNEQSASSWNGSERLPGGLGAGSL